MNPFSSVAPLPAEMLKTNSERCAGYTLEDTSLIKEFPSHQSSTSMSRILTEATHNSPLIFRFVISGLRVGRTRFNVQSASTGCAIGSDPAVGVGGDVPKLQQSSGILQRPDLGIQEFPCSSIKTPSSFGVSQDMLSLRVICIWTPKLNEFQIIPTIRTCKQGLLPSYSSFVPVKS